MNTLKSKETDEDKIERIVGNAVASESFEHLTVTDQGIEVLKRLARGNITMEEYLKSDCGDERIVP